MMQIISDPVPDPDSQPWRAAWLSIAKLEALTSAIHLKNVATAKVNLFAGAAWVETT